MKLGILERMARDGVKEMQFLFGFLKEHGLGCEKDIKEALHWYHRSASSGFMASAYMLYYINSRDKNQPEGRKHTDTAHTHAIEWCRIAASGGFAPAQLDLAMYASTQKESADLVLSAARQNYARAAHYMGSLYEHGHNGFEQDFQAAFSWYKTSGELGDESAACHVAMLLREGKGVEKNEQEALAWYRKAYEMKSHSAAAALGQIYSDGLLGQEQDKEKADAYYSKSLEYLKWWKDSFEHPD